MLKVLSLFSGIGAFEKALEKLNIEHELVNYCEIDKYASKSYAAIHNVSEDLNLGDITTVDTSKLPNDIDLLTHGSPCQGFSLAGKQAGGDKDSGTRSSLMYETIRIVRDIKPKYVIWENVKNLLSKKHRHNFDAYLNTMDQLGYNSYYEVLNSKDYGIPQNRERVFTVSIRKDIDVHDLFNPFEFPPKQELKLRLKDLLENDVDDNYYLSDEKISKIAHWKAHQKPSERVNGKESIVPTLTARGAGEDHSGMITFCEQLENTANLQEQCLYIKNNTKQGYLEAEDGDGVNICGRMQYQRGNVQKGMSLTLDTQNTKGVVVNEKPIKNMKEQFCNHLIENNLVKENDIINHSYTSARMNDLESTRIESNNMIPTLTTRCDTLGVVVDDKPICVGNYINKTSQCGKIYDPNGISMTVCAGTHGYATGNIEEKSGCNLRIRKLTPKECWRLMGFDDDDIDKCIAIGISNSQLYKQAGNSIVVNVLEEIFRELLKDYIKE